MAKHLYKKGNPGGPGRPKKDPDLKMAMAFTRTSVEKLLVRFLCMNLDELKTIMDDRKRPAIEHFVARIVHFGLSSGDQQKLNFLLERIVGKVRDQIEHTVIRPTVIERLDGSQVQLGVIDEGNSE